MNDKIDSIKALPGADLQAIKDWGRRIAFVVSKNKQVIADTVWYVLRNILRTDGVVHVLEPEQMQILIDLVDQQRDKIIELLQDKECLKVIAGSSKEKKMLE